MQVRQETWVQSLSGKDPLEEEMATHFSILAEKSQGQKRLAGYSPWGSRVRHDWVKRSYRISWGYKDFSTSFSQVPKHWLIFFRGGGMESITWMLNAYQLVQKRLSQCYVLLEFAKAYIFTVYKLLLQSSNTMLVFFISTCKQNWQILYGINF